jgi:hypothetical protein
MIALLRDDLVFVIQRRRIKTEQKVTNQLGITIFVQLVDSRIFQKCPPRQLQSSQGLRLQPQLHL